jgi:hypothetical protein
LDDLDLIAMVALIGILAKGTRLSDAEVAEYAYDQAEAMLKEREKRSGN